MDIRNIYLSPQQLSTKVNKVLKKEPHFMIILNDTGKQQTLFEAHFSSLQWRDIVPGSVIIWTVSRSVTGIKVEPPKLEKRIKTLIYKASKNTLGCYFIWICQDCGAEGYVEYADGDDNQRIAERILIAHAKENKPCCNRNIHIWDHRGMRQEESERFLSSCKAAL